MAPARVPYTKPFMPVADCLRLVEARGLEIPDMDLATRTVERAGYYRLSAYMYPFRKQVEPADQGVSPRTDEFRERASFDHVVSFYLWDKNIRMHVSDAIERIEILMRAIFIDILGEIGPDSHRQADVYEPKFSVSRRGRRSGFANLIAILTSNFAKSNADFARHFRQKYDGSPPIWIEAGTWTWGNMAVILENLLPDHQNEIAKRMHPNLSRGALKSWVTTLNEVRNDCAHHSRVWNKNLVNSPRLPNLHHFPEFRHLENRGRQTVGPTRKLYGSLVIMAHLIKEIHRNTRWHTDLRDMVLGEDFQPEVDPASAGFPSGWENETIWT